MALLSPFPITAADRILFFGDSITAPTRAWQLEFIRRLNITYFGGTSTLGAGHNPVRVRGGTPTGGPSRSPCYFNSAIGGQVIADLTTNFTAQFTVYNPTVAIGLIGVNDIVTAGTALATYTASEATLAGLFASNLPSCKVLRISILAAGEVWTSGTPNTWGPNAGSFDATIDSFNNAIRAQCVTSGYGYADARAYWLTLEPTGNPGKAASGYLLQTSDGVHPSDSTAGPFGAGKLAICDAVMAQCSVS